MSKHRTPTTTAELEDSIDKYFTFCIDKSLRPGVEALASWLGISRSMFWRWVANGQGKAKDPKWREICISAYQVIKSTTEALGLEGHINPATWIFTMKNLGWSDQVKITNENIDSGPTTAELPDLSPYLIGSNSNKEELPDLSGFIERKEE